MDRSNTTAVQIDLGGTAKLSERYARIIKKSNLSQARLDSDIAEDLSSGSPTCTMVRSTDSGIKSGPTA